MSRISSRPTLRYIEKNQNSASFWPVGVIIASLALNVILVAAFLRNSNQPQPDAQTSGSFSNQSGSSRRSVARPRTRSPVVYVTNSETAAFHWSQIESTDYKQYVTNLVNSGCPEQVVRDIIVSDVGKLFAARVAAIRPWPEPRKFWQKFKNPKPAPEELEKFKTLDKEKQDLFTEVLGKPVTSQQLIDELYLQDRFNDGHLSFLPAEKIEVAREAMQRADQRWMDRALEDDEDRDWSKRQREEEKERAAELSKVLSPQELEEYQLRTSDHANSLRYQLAGFQVTPDEFRALLKTRQELEEELPSGREQRERQKREAEAVKALLGLERYAEYERATDQSWRNAVQIATEQGLPHEVANRVFEAKKMAEAEVLRLRADKTLGEAQRAEQMSALKSQSEAVVRNALGEAGFKTYRKQGGYWLSNLR